MTETVSPQPLFDPFVRARPLTFAVAIIGALPIAVMLLVYITSPQYTSLLWTEPLGRFAIPRQLDSRSASAG
ncbi:hypothetical protein B4Q13_15205 [Lacticaseibacillus rhamnosus]